MTPNAGLERVIDLLPEQQLEWFREHPGLRMKWSEWRQFWCESLQHKGPCCSSCAEDWEYQGYPNFDEDCCCEGSRASQNGRSGASS